MRSAVKKPNIIFWDAELYQQLTFLIYSYTPAAWFQIPLGLFFTIEEDEHDKIVSEKRNKKGLGMGFFGPTVQPTFAYIPAKQNKCMM